MSYKIAIDSCGELLDEWKNDGRIESIPLTLTVGGENIIDDENFDQKDFLKKVAACPECPKSACPSPERYMKAYECDAEHIYAVTLSAELSGSYNSAILGKNLFLEEQPEKKVHVFNSKSASGGQSLIAMKIVECEEKGLSFEEVVSEVEKYIEEMNTFFCVGESGNSAQERTFGQSESSGGQCTEDQAGYGSYSGRNDLSAGSGQRHE